MIRTSKHTTNQLNENKAGYLDVFLCDYADAVEQYIDYIWNNKIAYEVNVKVKIPPAAEGEKPQVIETKEQRIIDIPNKKLNIPNFLSNKLIPIDSELSARMLNAALTQALGLIKSVTEKFHKKQYALSKKQKTQTKDIRKLQSWIDSHKPTKPRIDQECFKPELTSINCELIKNVVTSSIFSHHFVLKSVYSKNTPKYKSLTDRDNKVTNRIAIPIKMHTRSDYWMHKPDAVMMTSFMLSRDFVYIRWEVNPEENNSTVIVGADAGQTTTLTLSDGNITTPCPHGHDLKSINNKMARKKANSKAFKRACDHQVNYINWSIKQLNLGQYNEIRLESNKNIKRGKRTSKSLRHWSWSKINKAITLQAEERNVSVQLQRSPYKSQRCNSCGWVQKKEPVWKTVPLSAMPPCGRCRYE
jgi:hypothetical protein